MVFQQPQGHIMQFFRQLYNLRLKGDYKETFIIKKDLKKAIERAEMFINELKKYNC